MIDFKIISMVSKGLPWRQMINSAPCGSLQKLITSPSNYSQVHPSGKTSRKQPLHTTQPAGRGDPERGWEWGRMVESTGCVSTWTRKPLLRGNHWRGHTSLPCASTVDVDMTRLRPLAWHRQESVRRVHGWLAASLIHVILQLKPSRPVDYEIELESLRSSPKKKYLNAILRRLCYMGTTKSSSGVFHKAKLVD